MVRNWTFGRILSVGYALAALVLVVVAVAGYQSTSGLIENNEIVDRTHKQRRDLAELSARLTDAEAGMRGYVITGSTSFLAPYEGARERVRAIFSDLRGNISDPGQLRRLEAIWPLIEARLAEAQRAVRTRREGGLEPAITVVASETGKNLMDQIRAGIGELDRTAAELLDQREQIARSSARWTEGIILWGGIAGLILVAVAGWLTISLLTAKVGRAVGQVESSSAELQAAANQQASGAKEQASAMSEIATTIRELIATSRQIAESSQKVAQVADDTDASARAGEETVEKANQSIGGIRHQVDLIVSHMLDLGKKSQQIGSVLDIVSELAEQTHILAVNATIEAAGAGEAGKRFGVVADEIRKLSDRVAGSTKEIRGLIDDVRAAVNTTVMVTESGSKAVDAGSRQFEEVTSSFKRISSMVSTTTGAAKEIELSTKQQSTAVEQVDIATSNVAQATKETEASSGQILQTASELAELSRDLARLIRSEARA